MIISRTPLRVSFLGGGTDYPAHFHRHGGATLATTIDQYTTITIHPLTRFSDHRIKVHYSQVECVDSIDEIGHPSARECLRFMGVDGGVEIHYVTDMPARAGLGSSSSATVGLLHALHAFKGERVSREELAAEAVHVEQNLIKERVGCQDQYACAMGGLLHLQFSEDRVGVVPVDLPPHRLRCLGERLMLFYTGMQRQASELLDEQLQRTECGDNETQLRRMTDLVAAGLDVLRNGKGLAEFGVLLDDSWQLKRGLSSRISTPWVDDVYARARKAGAAGGKLLGAGGGGFLLLFVEPDRQQCVRDAIPDVREASFAFETGGSAIIFP